MRGLGMPFVLALGPEAAQEVFAHNDHVFSHKSAELFLGRFFKRGLMFLDFEEHHFHRIMQDAFARERLGGCLDSMDTIGRAAAAALSDDELLVYPYLKRTLLDIATVVFMGDEPGPQSRASSALLGSPKRTQATIPIAELDTRHGGHRSAMTSMEARRWVAQSTSVGSEHWR